MAYKKETVVISVPLDRQTNRMLHEIALKLNEKSKTRYVSRILASVIMLQYKNMKKEEQEHESGI